MAIGKIWMLKKNFLITQGQTLIQSNFNNHITIDKNIAMLNIGGVIATKPDLYELFFGNGDFLTIFDYQNAFLSLENNPMIDKIVLNIDSPGGSVTGIFELAEMIKNSKKQVFVYTQSMCCSAAYLIASAANKIIATPSAEVGSIGVYLELYKNSNSQDTHLIYAGDKKVYGHPGLQLTDAELKYFQEEVDTIYELFVDTVSNYRNIPKEALKNMQGASGWAMNNPLLVDDVMLESEFERGLYDF